MVFEFIVQAVGTLIGQIDKSKLQIKNISVSFPYILEFYWKNYYVGYKFKGLIIEAAM